LADEGNIEAALQLCDTLIIAYPLHANFHFYRALLLDQIAGHEAALESLNRAIYLDREFVLAHYYTGTTLLKLSNSAGAIRSFRNVQRLIAARDPAECLPDAEGMTITDLNELTQLHIESLEAA
jgi:chemotaxis protein methyltransferase CheR